MYIHIFLKLSPNNGRKWTKIRCLGEGRYEGRAKSSLFPSSLLPISTPFCLHAFFHSPSYHLLHLLHTISKDGSPPAATGAGAAVYQPIVLKVYDIFVLKFSNNHAWRCPTTLNLRPFFTKNLSQNHLDIGVGTGYYLHQAIISRALTQNSKVTLLDLNPNALDAASKQLEHGAGIKAQKLQWNAMKPLPLLSSDATPMKFDSMSLFYLLHCMPGPLSAKTYIFGHLTNNLSSNGVLYGATILGKGKRIRHNLLGCFLMWVYNRKGVFGNVDDTEEGIVSTLKEYFEDVKTSVVGVVLLFRAQGVKKT